MRGIIDGIAGRFWLPGHRFQVVVHGGDRMDWKVLGDSYWVLGALELMVGRY